MAEVDLNLWIFQKFNKAFIIKNNFYFLPKFHTLLAFQNTLKRAREEKEEVKSQKSLSSSANNDDMLYMWGVRDFYQKNVCKCASERERRASEWEYKKELLHITHSDSHLHENKLYNNNNTEKCKCFRMEMASVRCVLRERCLGER